MGRKLGGGEEGLKRRGAREGGRKKWSRRWKGKNCGKTEGTGKKREERTSYVNRDVE